MRRYHPLLWIAAALAFAAPAANAAPCSVRKGLYDNWLSLAKHAPRIAPNSGALVATGQPAPDQAPAQTIREEYRAFFQCLSDAAVPAEDAAAGFCKDAANDRLGALVCELALYVKTGRGAGKALLDALPASRKAAEMIWDLEEIAVPSRPGRFPDLFLPAGPAYKLLDEVIVLVLDDRDTAVAKYFWIADAASGAGAAYTDSQIKILLREAAPVVVKRWAILRQHQPRLRKVLSELATELPPAEMNKLRSGIAAFCPAGNLDCPEILRVFGRPE